MDNPTIDNAENVKNPSPFITFTARTIPATFDTSMSYQEALFALVNYLKTQVTPVINENAKITNKQTKAINDLYDFVNHYFDNLDVQEKINNKLDAMVEDGTMATIINEEIFGELNQKVDTNTENISTLNTALSNETTARQTADTNLSNRINSLEYVVNQKKKEPFNNKNKIVRKVGSPQYGDFEILKGDYSYNVSLSQRAIDDYKNTGSNTWYISPNGNDSADGTTPATAKKNLGALVNAHSGDTFVLLPGIYMRASINANILKSCNIIAEKPHTVFLTNSIWVNDTSVGTWSVNSTYSDVYQFSHQNIHNTTGVVDLSDRDNPIGLKKVNSLEACHNTPNSFAVSSGIIYVHLYNNGVVNQSNVVINYPWNYASAFIDTNLNHIKVYFENIDFIGGSNASVLLNQSADGTRHQVTFNKCRFMFTETGPGLKNEGCSTRCIDCEASFNANDGFSYHTNAIGLEIRCKGCYNGHEGAYSNNGSTAHESQIFRANCEYHHNVGPNIADVFASTISVNYNCVCYDSLYAGSTPINGADFQIQEGVMYLLGCHTKGSTSLLNINNYNSGGTLYVDSMTTYDTSNGTLSPFTPTSFNVNPKI